MGETQNFPDLAAKLADALYEQGKDDLALELSEVSERATAPDDLSAGVQWRGVRRSCWPGAATARRPRCSPVRAWRSPRRPTSPSSGATR